VEAVGGVTSSFAAAAAEFVDFVLVLCCSTFSLFRVAGVMERENRRPRAKRPESLESVFCSCFFGIFGENACAILRPILGEFDELGNRFERRVRGRERDLVATVSAATEDEEEEERKRGEDEAIITISRSIRGKNNSFTSLQLQITK
jgi:hypothetical protein